MSGAAAAAVCAGPVVLAVSATTPANGVGTHAPVTTSLSTASVAGGTAPYTYAWSLVDALGTWVILNPTSPSTAFRCTDVPDGEVDTAQFVCTVTDAGAHSAVSNIVFANATAWGSGSPP